MSASANALAIPELVGSVAVVGLRRTGTSLRFGGNQQEAPLPEGNGPHLRSVVRGSQSCRAGVQAEIRDSPADYAQVIQDRRDVVELVALLPADRRSYGQPCAFHLLPRERKPAVRLLRNMQTGQPAQVVIAVEVNLLGDERAPGARTRLTSAARNASCLLATSPNTPSPKGSRPRSSPLWPVLSGAPSSRTTGIPSGRSLAAATATLGGHASVATVRGGRGESRARRSPPPVPMSSMVSVAAARLATSRR